MAPLKNMINRRFRSESLHINYKTDSLGSIVGESRPDEGTPDTQYNMLFEIKQTEQRRHRLRTVYCCHLRGSKRLLGHDVWPCIPSAWASTRSGRLKNGSTALYFECTRRIHCCVQDGGWWNRHERGDAGRSSHSQNNTNTSPEAGSRKDSVAGVRLTEVPRRVVRPASSLCLERLPEPPRWWRAGSKSSSNKINGSVTAHMRGRSVVGMLRVRGGRNQTLLKRFLHFGKQAVTQKCRGKADKICCHQLLPSRSAHPHSFAESRNAGRPHVFVWAVVTTVHSFGDQFSKQSQCFG